MATDKMKLSDKSQDALPTATAKRQLERALKLGCRNVDVYEKIEQVGEGTYGQVYKARNKFTGDIVALKRIRMDNEREGFPITAMREIKILQRITHKNLVKLIEIVTSKGSVYMVFEYMDHDITGLLAQADKEFTVPQIKCYMTQVLQGLQFLHSCNILHRDIKGSNLLVNNRGELKLADFGLARWDALEGRHYTNRVITLWYRPPELLLGVTEYKAEIDIWSVGCILVEMYIRRPLFHGHDEISQLESIFKICGTPTDEIWPSMKSLPWYKLTRPRSTYQNRLKEELEGLSSCAIDLIEKMLALDPTKRISAAEALLHPYFTQEEPLACSIEDLPKYVGDCHEFDTKNRKRRVLSTQESASKVARRESSTSSSVVAM